MVNLNLKNRFLKYVSFDTQSNDESNTIPSSMKQKDLGKYLVEELKKIGINDTYIDEFGYVYGYLKSNCNSDKTIGLIAHMDTSDEISGAFVKPNIISSYNGEIITINKELDMFLDPKEFPYLQCETNHELIITDGTTLLGADDKAGIAIIITAVEELIKSSANRPNLIITFTPDEEIGRGTVAFNYDYYKKYNCNIAYTIDGSEPNVVNYENFNAASCSVNINGKSVHPGSAKNKMINSMLVAMEYNSLLPSGMIPSLTENYEGFHHLINIKGTVSNTKLDYIIRSFDKEEMQKQKDIFYKACEYINTKYDKNLCTVNINDSYYNMKEIVEKYPNVIKIAEEAIKENGLIPINEPIRGGTDGARLTFEGIVTPNLGTGGHLFHGPYEYLDVNEASLMVSIVKTLINKYLY